MGYFSGTYKVIFGCCMPARIQENEPVQENEPTEEKVPTHDVIISETMDERLRQMQIASTKPRVTFLDASHDPPYPEWTVQFRNTEVTIPGPYTALCVGITLMAEVGDKDFLVSDSFASCVPVIVFAADKTWLAHSNGMSAVDQVNAVATPARKCKVFIIRKMMHAHQADVAKNIGERLKHLSPEIVEIHDFAHLGVIVSPISKTVLVYRQKGATKLRKESKKI